MGDVDKIIDSAHKLKEELWAFMETNEQDDEEGKALKDSFNEMLDCLDEFMFRE